MNSSPNDHLPGVTCGGDFPLATSGVPTSWLDSSRAEKKEQRRREIRAVARRLFDQRGFEAVRIADIAAAAGVSVQTVFNHCSAKEELFFDGRTPWVDGPALAVQARPWHVAPLSALRGHLVQGVRETVYQEATPEGRRYIAAIEASTALATFERELTHRSQRLLSAALTLAWTAQLPETTVPPSEDPALIAALVAATSLAAVRELVVAQRAVDDAPEALASRAAGLAAELLHRLSYVSGSLGRLPASMPDGG